MGAYPALSGLSSMRISICLCILLLVVVLWIAMVLDGEEVEVEVDLQLQLLYGNVFNSYRTVMSSTVTAQRAGQRAGKRGCMDLAGWGKGGGRGEEERRGGRRVHEEPERGDPAPAQEGAADNLKLY